MNRQGPDFQIEVANGLVEPMARRYHAEFKRKVALEELQSFARIGAAEALRHWDGRGYFEAFAIQRIRWAILRGARRWLLRNAAPVANCEEHAIVATQQAAEESDEASTQRRELIEQSALRFRMDLGLAEEACQVPDPTQDVEGDSARSQVRAAVALRPQSCHSRIMRSGRAGSVRYMSAATITMVTSRVPGSLSDRPAPSDSVNR